MSVSAPPAAVFEQFVEQYYQWLLRFVCRKVANREQAEDLLHDALLDAHLGLQKYRGEAALSAWVLGVLSNKIRRHYRYQAHMPDMVHDELIQDSLTANGDPSEHLSQTQRLDCLCDFVDALPEKIKRALCKVALDGEAYALVARRLDIPVGTLRSQLSRAREQMRNALDAAGVGRTDLYLNVMTESHNAMNSTLSSPKSDIASGASSAMPAGAAFGLSDSELEALYSMAHQLHVAGMRSKAHDLFAFIAACKPRSIRYNKALGISLMSNSDYEAAIPVLATAILCSPGSDPTLSVACAECLALTNRHQQARRLFKKAKTMLRQHDNSPEIDRLTAHADGWLTILKDR